MKKSSLTNEPTVSTNEKMQDLIMPIFSKRMGKWGRDLGQMINTVVEKKDHSDLFKATVMYYFYKDFDLSKEYFKILTLESK